MGRRPSFGGRNLGLGPQLHEALFLNLLGGLRLHVVRMTGALGALGPDGPLIGAAKVALNQL